MSKLAVCALPSVLEPPLRSGIIDRYIVAALEGGLSIVLAINKIDLASPDAMEEVLERLDDLVRRRGAGAKRRGRKRRA